MLSKWFAVLIPLSVSFPLACGSSDSTPTQVFPRGEAGEAGDVGTAAGTAAAGKLEPAGGAGGTAGHGTPSSGAAGEGLGGSDVSGAGGVADPGNAGQGGSNENGGVVDEAAGASFAGSAGQAGESNEPSHPLGVHCEGCTSIALGNPKWGLAGAAMAVGTVGSIDDPDASAFFGFLDPILAPNHKYDSAEYYYGPGTAHAGPYTDEGFAAFSAANISVKQSFSTADFTAPSGVLLTLNAVPIVGAALGSSPDFELGPVIPNGLFPLVVDADLFRNGVLYDPNFDSTYSGLDVWQPPWPVAGSSHTMLWFAENSSFGAPVPPQGNYEYRISVIDSEGSGWAATVPFTVIAPANP